MTLTRPVSTHRNDILSQTKKLCFILTSKAPGALITGNTVALHVGSFPAVCTVLTATGQVLNI